MSARDHECSSLPAIPAGNSLKNINRLKSSIGLMFVHHRLSRLLSVTESSMLPPFKERAMKLATVIYLLGATRPAKTPLVLSVGCPVL
jgi:hypothetical protein